MWLTCNRVVVRRVVATKNVLIAVMLCLIAEDAAGLLVPVRAVMTAVR